MKTRLCKNRDCINRFQPVTVWQRFCSSFCRNHHTWLIRKALLKQAQKGKRT